MAIRVPLPAHEADDSAEGQERGRSVAFEDLWQHRAELRDICQRIVGDAATADDVVQETYLRALRNLDRLEQRPSLMPWLATVARRRSIDELRRRHYQRPVDALPDDTPKIGLDPSETASVNETVATVRDALTALSERERELLMRQVNQGLSLTELADFDQSSVASVRSVLSRARTKLRDALDEAGARVIAPVGLVGGWMKRQLGAVNARVQRMPTVLPAGYERVGEMAGAAVAAAALAITGALPSATDGSEPAIVLADAIASSSDAAQRSSVASSGDGAAGLFGLGGGRGSAAQSGGGAAETGSAGGSGSGGADSPGGVPTDAAEGVPVPDPTRERAVPQAPEDDPLTQPEPQSPEDTHITQIVAPTPAASSPDPQPVFALGTMPCGPDPCDVLWYSPDGGETWTRRSAGGFDARAIAVPDGYSSSNGVVYATGPSGLHLSYDGGGHFEPVTGASAYTGSVAPSPGFSTGDPSLYLGGAPNGRHDAENGTTLPLAMGLPAQDAYFAFAPSFPTTDVMYAGTMSLGDEDWVASVYRCSGGSCASGRGPAVLAGVSKPPVVAVPASSADGSLVLAWSGARLFRSTDAGAAFSPVTLGVPGVITGFAEHGGNLYLSFKHVGPDASSGAVVRSTDAGATWREIPVDAELGVGVDALSSLADGTLLAAPRGKGLLCSTNGGASWASRCETD